MSVAVRELTVLGEFKPFGLIAESLDGKPSHPHADEYDYFLFEPDTVSRDEDTSDMEASSDHELFIRSNRITWTIGSRVFKRFTLQSPVIMACWTHLGDISGAFLCVLQAGCLTIYNISGEVISIPLPRTITSIWPLPVGLLLQQVSEVTPSRRTSFKSSSPILGVRDMPHPRKETRKSPQQNFSYLSAHDHVNKGDITFASSHLILRDPSEDPELTYVEEGGKLSMMKGFDERTIWTSNQISLVASYNQEKMQHSVWAAEVVKSNIEAFSLVDVAPVGVLPSRVSFRRIWQAKGAQKAASQVFLATDDDAAPVICFLLLDQKKLLSIRLRTVEINIDIEPDRSWSIPAIAAAPLIVTRPRVKVGLLTYTDIIILSPDNILHLYTGKLCLCRYLLPSCLSKGLAAHDLKFAERAFLSQDLKITGLADAVGGRINVIVTNGQMFRCVLRRSPSSSLANDCISAMAEGLSSDFYNHFLSLLWGDGDSSYLSEANSTVDAEWDAFCSIIMRMCRKYNVTSPKPNSVQNSSWEFLLSSKFHKNYCKINHVTANFPGKSHDLQGPVASVSSTESSDKSFYLQLLVEGLDSLHAVYESLKMDILRKRDLELLAVLLCNISKFLGEECYMDHYIRDFPSLSNIVASTTNSFSMKRPPSLFRWLENCLQHGCSSANATDLPALIAKDGNSVVSWARKIICFYSVLCGAKPVGKNLSSGIYCNTATGSYSSNEELSVLAMVGERFGLQQLDSLPAGVSLPLRHALDKCRESPPTDWPVAAYVLLGREDLALSSFAYSSRSKELGAQTDVNLISMSTPYMLHLHPVIIPSSFSDTIGSESTKFEDTDAIDGSMTDGMEHIFNSSTQLRYGRDLRLNEVRRLLCSAKPVAIQMSGNSGISEQEQQQDHLWRIAQRTTALPFGRGAFTLATIYTLLTEAFTVPKLVLAGRLPAQQNATVNLDPNMRNVQELKTWPEFHNATAAGLRLAPLQGKVSRTWIIYNKTEEPNVTHAGLLLALGLHGYLRVLTISDIYQYFTQEHESTTLGLMLGLAASYRGTMQPAISKALFIHIPARYPSSFTDLEIPTLLQSAALMSVGILYEGSAHPQTMHFLLGEIGRRSGGDNVLEREGYAVSAGFSLGLVALGRGDDALGFMDTFVGRLFHYIGGKEVHSERSLMMQSTDEHNRVTTQMMDGTTVNVDVTAPGAIIALALMFLKTESEVIVSRLSIPQTHFALQYVRPDFIMLRVIARNLIMWTRVHPTIDWIQSQIPEVVKSGIKHLGDDMDIDEMDPEALVQAYINIVAGACISLGLRFAGTRDENAQELLYDYAVYLLNEIKPVCTPCSNSFPKGLSLYVDRGTLENCLHLILLSLSVVMAGSGDLKTLRLLRYLRNRNSGDGLGNFGIQMAVSLAIGFLFLGGGMRTFSTSNSSIAALLITLYPRLPTGSNDNRCHLQAFRHFYVLATEGRWIQTIDVDTGLPVYAPLEVTIRETELYSETSFCEVTPCILPERAILRRIRVCGPRYWPQVIELVPEDKPWWSFEDKKDPFNSGVLYIKRKVGACSYVDDPIGCQSLLSRAMHKVFGLKSLASDSIANDNRGMDSDSIDQLVSTFSSDPSLIAFAQLCCDNSWNSRSDSDFKEFCLQVLFECVSKDRPALLQVYLSLYTTVGAMAEQVISHNDYIGDSLAISSLKLALTYNEAVSSGKLSTSRGGIVQSIFLASLRKRVEEILDSSEKLKDNLYNYLISEKWPTDESQATKDLILLSWYLHWFGVPAASVVKAAVKKIKPKLKSSSSVPLLRLLLPSIQIKASNEIDRLFFSSQSQVRI